MYKRQAFQLAGSDANELWKEVVERDIRKLLEASISKLPPKCRQAFELSYFKEMPYKEIAAAMHISSRTVEEHVQKDVYKRQVQVLHAFQIFFSGNRLHINVFRRFPVGGDAVFFLPLHTILRLESGDVYKRQLLFCSAYPNMSL